ncbi:MAG TPA: SDR family NAD(P)-dependent oxidoreductase, partial [Saprospiraceae bacterium]|nr:SDR family NAD(P)-dependent oxidoreductase [Saprospiraceae bacterium]
MNKQLNLKDKVVVITGAGSGIGRALARGFSNDQALVMGFGRTREHLEETKSLCDGTMDYRTGDVRSEDEVRSLLRDTAEQYGPIDILINNAGIKLSTNSFVDGDFSNWEQVIDINLKGAALCCKMALPYMLDKNYGRIVNLTSRRAEAERPDASYSVSKAAL